jgi:hypothetical protein
MFSKNSHQGLKEFIKFLMCIRDLPIAPYFYPICFAQTCSLLISIDGSKARNSIFLYCEYDLYFKEPPKFQ